MEADSLLTELREALRNVNSHMIFQTQECIINIELNEHESYLRVGAAIFFSSVHVSLLDDLVRFGSYLPGC